MFRPRPTVFENARIVSMSGPPIENGSLVVAGGKVQEVGKAPEKNDKATVIDLKGRTITPGFVDVDGALAVTEVEGGSRRGGGGGGGPSSGTADPTNLAFDAFDRYATETFKDALRNGVTAVYLSPRTGAATGITGTGAVVRLMPGDGPFGGVVVKEQAALCIDLGSENGPLERLQTLDRVRRQFKAAIDYREALETYKDELDEYEKKIKERAEKNAKEEKPKDEKKDGQTPDGKKPDAKKPEEAKPEKKDEGPAPAPPVPPVPPKTPQGDFQPQPERRPTGPPAPQDSAKPGDAKRADTKPADAKKEDDLKKPVEPMPDRKSAVLLRAIDRDIPVRIRCERSEDIYNALELAEEFSLRLIIDGGTEAHLVAKDIAKAGAPVVLGRATGRDYFKNDALQRRLPEAAAVLSENHVEWHVGSGGGDTLGSRFVLLNAALTAPQIDEKDALTLVTTDAADFLGVGDKIGRLAPGRAADFVVWSGDPLDPASRVEEVYVGGELVYRAPDLQGGAP